MEDLEAQKKVIGLGKLLVEQLGLERSVDTLSRWMAHYLAERMAYAEQALGENKKVADRECYELILILWSKRSKLPNGIRPYEDYEMIFETLMRLKPEKGTPFFYRNYSRGSNDESEKNEEINKDSEALLDVALDIDRVVRIWLDFILMRAAKLENNEKLKKWLDNSIDLQESYDSKIIFSLIGSEEFGSPDGDKNNLQAKELEIEKMEKRLNELEKFKAFNDWIEGEYKNRLTALRG